MLVPSDRIALLALITGLCLPALGCTKAAMPRSLTTGDALAEEEGRQPMDPLAELDVLEQRMRALGLPVAGSGGSPPSEAKAEAEAEAEADESDGDMRSAAKRRDEPRARERARDKPGAQGGDAPDDMAAAAPGPSTGSVDPRCENLCDLSGAICELEVKICGLSELHAGDPTYAEACSRAIDDCEVASDACDHCAS